MPRLRNGKYLLWARQEDGNPWLEAFQMKKGRKLAATKLKGQGFKVEFTKSEKPNEQAYLDANIAALNDLMQNALKRMKRSSREAWTSLGSRAR